MKGISVAFIVVLTCRLHPAGAVESSAQLLPEEKALVSLGKTAAKLEELQQLPDEQAIPELGERLRKLAIYSIYPTESRWPVYYQYQEALISIPGHAEYYRQKIEEEERLATRPNVYRGTHDRRRAWHFETLQHMPSPETVRVLGDMLFYEREKPIPPEQLGDVGAAANPTLATRALCVLPIVDPPVRIVNPVDPNKELPMSLVYEFAGTEHQIEAWRLWYEPVKAGTRTFRFEGDPREYRLADPPRDRSRPPKPDAVPGVAGTGKEGGRPGAWWPYLIGPAALIAALAYAFWRPRKTAFPGRA